MAEREYEDEVPSLKKYYDKVAELLGIPFEEVAELDVSDDAEDEEGWDSKSFFPKDTEITEEDYYDEGIEPGPAVNAMDLEAFSIGRIVVVKDKEGNIIAVGDQNASPLRMFGKQAQKLPEEEIITAGGTPDLVDDNEVDPEDFTLSDREQKDISRTLASLKV